MKGKYVDSIAIVDDEEADDLNISGSGSGSTNAWSVPDIRVKSTSSSCSPFRQAIKLGIIKPRPHPQPSKNHEEFIGHESDLDNALLEADARGIPVSEYLNRILTKRRLCKYER